MTKEYIEKEAIGQTMLELPCKVDDDGYIWVLRRDVFRAVDDFSAADVRENVKARWEWIEAGDESCYYCTNCGEHNFYQARFCPDCGAQMGGAEDDMA